MKPRIFDSSTTDFTTNGLGTLSDAVSCLIEENRNGAYFLTMTYPVTGANYSALQLGNIIGAQPFDGGSLQGFRIYKITKPINQIVTVIAQHVSYQLTLIPAAPFTAGSAAGALIGLKSNSMQENPFEFWTDVTGAGSYVQTVPASVRNRLGGSQGSVLDVYGGEFEWDNYTVKLFKNRGQNNGVSLRYGKNLIDLSQEESIENTFTSVLPYFDRDGVVIYGQVVHSAHVDAFAYPRTLVYDFTQSFDVGSTPTAEELNELAAAYISANGIGVPAVNLQVSFLPLWQTDQYKNIAPLERVKLCDTVNVFFEKLGVNATAKVIRTVYDSLSERYEVVELGNAKSNLAATIAGLQQEVKNSEKNTKSMIDSAIGAATALITGEKGGNIVLRTDSAGRPYEWLIMDTADISTATKVWRWNLGGLGYSGNGYSGDYRAAITQGGAIVADFITAGTLTANILKAGIISDTAGRSFWNLESGELQMIANALEVDGKDVSAGIDTANAANNTAQENAENLTDLQTNLQENYTTVTDLNSAIQQTANEINAEVNTKIETAKGEAVETAINTAGISVQGDQVVIGFKENGRYTASATYTKDGKVILENANSAVRQQNSAEKMAYMNGDTELAAFTPDAFKMTGLRRFQLGGFAFTVAPDGIFRFGRYNDNDTGVLNNGTN